MQEQQEVIFNPQFQSLVSLALPQKYKEVDPARSLTPQEADFVVNNAVRFDAGMSFLDRYGKARQINEYSSRDLENHFTIERLQGRSWVIVENDCYLDADANYFWRRTANVERGMPSSCYIPTLAEAIQRLDQIKISRDGTYINKLHSAHLHAHLSNLELANDVLTIDLGGLPVCNGCRITNPADASSHNRLSIESRGLGEEKSWAIVKQRHLISKSDFEMTFEGMSTHRDAVLRSTCYFKSLSRALAHASAYLSFLESTPTSRSYTWREGE